MTRKPPGPAGRELGIKQLGDTSAGPRSQLRNRAAEMPGREMQAWVTGPEESNALRKQVKAVRCLNCDVCVGCVNLMLQGFYTLLEQTWDNFFL